MEPAYQGGYEDTFTETGVPVRSLLTLCEQSEATKLGGFSLGASSTVEWLGVEPQIDSD